MDLQKETNHRFRRATGNLLRGVESPTAGDGTCRAVFYHARLAHTITIRRLSINVIPPRGDHDSVHMPCGTAQFRRSLSASGIAWAYTLLAWDQFMGSDCVGRVPIERKLARVPAPRVIPREPKSLLQANVTIDHRKKKKKGRRPQSSDVTWWICWGGVQSMPSSPCPHRQWGSPRQALCLWHFTTAGNRHRVARTSV